LQKITARFKVLTIIPSLIISLQWLRPKKATTGKFFLNHRIGGLHKIRDAYLSLEFVTCLFLVDGKSNLIRPTKRPGKIDCIRVFCFSYNRWGEL